MYSKQLVTLAVWLLASTALFGADKKAKILLIGTPGHRHERVPLGGRREIGRAHV